MRLILFVLFISLLSCNKNIQKGKYTDAYKKNGLYFAGTEIEILDSANFELLEFTDVIGYDKTGNGIYKIKNSTLVLSFQEVKNKLSEKYIRKREILIKNTVSEIDSSYHLEIFIRD